jgi:phosphomethylpyrimidine synthase
MCAENQIAQARQSLISNEVLRVAEQEDVTPEVIARGIAAGEIVILANKRSVSSKKKICAIGKGLRTKVNANIGTSRDFCDVDVELKKLAAAQEAGADTVMDLSTGGNLTQIREKILTATHIPLGTVPIYDVIHSFCSQGKTVNDAREEDFLGAVETHAKQGVDFVTVHCGLTLEGIKRIQSQGRKGGIVSRGGAFLAQWMVSHKKENPLFTYYDDLIAIAQKYDLVLSLGDALRPGSLDDATDRGQVHELIVLGELQKRAFDRGVQVIIEGPGHVPLDQIEANMILQKKLCNNAPFYVLGPLVTDVAPGYDHIVSAIGGALAARYGADFLCYVTPAEHLRLPQEADVYEGVIASRIAGHAADIVKLGARAKKWDDDFSAFRFKRDWAGQMRMALDPKKAKVFHEQIKPALEDTCTMCGEYCSYRLNEKLFNKGTI